MMPVPPAPARGAGDDEGHVRARHDVQRQPGEREGEEDRQGRQQFDAADFEHRQKWSCTGPRA